MNSTRIAFITYHAAYNYGSALQAFALQQVLFSLDYNSTVLNYRPKGQKECYKLLRTNSGIKNLVKDIFLLPIYRKRRDRNTKFEDFFLRYYNMTNECNNIAELLKLENSYDMFISGSDQIWNKHSNELHNVDWDQMDPYLLTFTKKRKISYASSIGSMTKEEILNIVDYINKFNYISAREDSVARNLSNYTNKIISCVLDPTLLLDKDFYIKKFNLINKNTDRYIFYYSLENVKLVNEDFKFLKSIVKRENYKIVFSTPYAFVPTNKNFINIANMGPIDFLQYIYNADLVVTNSFHGTAFAINFNKNFFSICKEGGSEYRKTELLTKFCLQNRIVKKIQDIEFKLNRQNIDYNIVNKKIDMERKESVNYLLKAITK